MHIQEYLDKYNISRMDFAHQTKIHYHALCFYIIGRRVPTIKIAEKIIEASNGEITMVDLRGRHGKKFATLTDAGKFLKICRQGVFSALKTGHLKGEKIGGHWHFEEDDLWDYLKQKYERKKRLFKGRPIVDHEKGEYTVADITLLFNERIKRRSRTGREIWYKRQWIYHLLRKGTLPYTRRGILYIIKIEDAEKIYQEELKKYPQHRQLSLI